jgi:hypothetical protein
LPVPIHGHKRSDTTPDAYGFADQTGVAPNTLITSGAVQIAGINAAAVITVTGGTYSINGAAFTALNGMVVAGDLVRAQHTSSPLSLTSVNTTVTVGGVSDTFTSTTASASNQPPVWSGATTYNINVGVSFSLDLDTLASDAELQPITYTVFSGALPAGLAQSGSRGNVVSGTPTAAQSYAPTMRADDLNGGQANRAFTFNVTSIAPQIPQNLIVTGFTSNSISLAWDPVPTVPNLGYRVQGSTNGGVSWSYIATFNPGTATYTDRGLGSGVTKYYRVTACTLIGGTVTNETAPSNVVNATTSIVSGVTLTRNVLPGGESRIGQQGGALLWVTDFLLNDGRIASWGIGFHGNGHEGTNAMRIIDPVTTPGSVTTYDDWPWTQTGGTHDDINGFDMYVSVYDNHNTMYIPSENKSVWVNHGVFDHATKAWTYGDLAPSAQPWTQFVDTSATVGFEGIYNSVHAWCAALDKGIWYGWSGGSASHLGVDTLVLLERSPSGSAKPWRTRQVNLGTQYGIAYSRNHAVVVGTNMYIGGTGWDGASDGPVIFFKVDLVAETVTATLAPFTLGPGTASYQADYFPQMVYDSARGKIMLLAYRLQEYDIAANTWTDVSPNNWLSPTVDGATANGPAFTGLGGWRGVYHPGNNAIYFSVSGRSYDAPCNYQWHKLVFPQTTNGRYTPVNVSSSANPFSGLAKHVDWSWHPVKKRVYTFGGDFSNGNGTTAFSYDGGTGTDTMPGGGGTFTTNKPAGASTYTEAQGSGAGSTSYRNDMYSIDPYATTATVPWRLEHPYLPINQAGNPENRPPCNCQRCLRWDSLRNKYWSITTHERGASDASPGMYGLDPWAIGTTTAQPNNDEPVGTWSWIPSASGGAGTFTFETTNALILKSGFGSPTYVGGRLYTSHGAERIGMISERHAPTDAYVAVSALPPGNSSDSYLFAFKPGTKTYEYRRVFVSGARGWSYIASSTSPVALIGDYAYVIGLGKQSGVFKSVLLKVNVTAAMALANGGTLADNTTNWEVFTLPFSLSVPIVKFNQGGSGRILEGDTITGQTSGAHSPTATLNPVTSDFLDLNLNPIPTSAWTAGSAAGFMAITQVTGTFQSGELVTSPNGSARLTSGFLDGAWENVGSAAANWMEHCGVLAANGKIAVVCSYDRLVNGVTKFSIFNPNTSTFTAAQTPPDTNIAANSWVALPDTGEIMFGLNTSGYTDNILWRYRMP